MRNERCTCLCTRVYYTCIIICDHDVYLTEIGRIENDHAAVQEKKNKQLDL